MIVFLSLLAALWLFLYLSPAHRFSFRTTLDAATPLADPVEWPAVTLVVPARNEAAIIGRSIPSMCRQEYPGLRVILVDDQSDDATPAIADGLLKDHPNLTVIRTQDRPAGWCGKPWAVSQGVAAAGADAPLLLFTDADILFDPRAVRQAVRLLIAKDLDMVSLFPQCTFGSVAERLGLVGLISVLALAFPLGMINNPKRGAAMAAGGFMLIRRAAYESVGGHECVKAHIVEDVNLARKLKAAGRTIHLRMTRDLISTRMYESFADLWEGLAKNAYGGMDYRPERFWVGAIVGLTFGILPPLYLAGAAAYALTHWPPTPGVWVILALTLAINLLMVLVHRRTTKHFRLSPLYAVTLPLSLALYQLIAASSFYQHYFAGGNTWKGRRYDREMLLAGTTPEKAP